MRTFHTTLSFEMIQESLSKEGLAFQPNSRGRIFFRLPHYPETCIELLRGGTLMLKGGNCIGDLLDDHLIAELSAIQFKYFPSTVFVSYRLSNVHASRRWLRNNLEKCVEAMAPGTFQCNNHSNSILQNLHILRKGEQGSDELTDMKKRRFQQFLTLVISGRKEPAWTPIVYDNVIEMDQDQIMAMLDMRYRFTVEGARNTVTFFNPQKEPKS